MSRPIRPEEVVCVGIPDNVVEVFNELIQENLVRSVYERK